MEYLVTNLTFQPLRLIQQNSSVTVLGRKKITINEITEQIKNLQKKGLIKIREKK